MGEDFQAPHCLTWTVDQLENIIICHIFFVSSIYVMVFQL